MIVFSTRLIHLARQPGWHLPIVLRKLSTGQSFQKVKKVSQDDVDVFVRLTDDSNPIHVGQATAAAVAPVVPGLLLASMFPAIIGSNFPGALYLSQSLKFRRSAPVGCTVLATVTVTKCSSSRVTFATVCQDDNGHVLVDGTALAFIKAPAAASP